MTNRKQVAYCNKKTSMLKTIVRGVSQGSIMGPLLCFVYINDISKASNKFNYVPLAYDTNLLLQNNDLNHLNAMLNIE